MRWFEWLSEWGRSLQLFDDALTLILQCWGWFKQWWRNLGKPLTLGQRGELAAAKYLQKLGYIILARSSRTKLGEIDIVAVDKNTVVFVEVKTREDHAAGHPAEAVDANKQRKLTHLALQYIHRHQLQDTPARFDVIAITWPHISKSPILQHYINAFEMQE
jgi:putative endonuclease